MSGSITRLLTARVGIILTLVLGLLLASWASFPVLAPRLAAPLLEARGIELHRLDTERPGLHGIRIHTLALADAAAGLSLRGSDIQIAWEPSLRALRQGLSSVIIGNLELAFDPPAHSPDLNADDPSASAITTPAAMLAGLPARHLEVTQLRVQGRIAQQDVSGEGSLRASSSDAFFSGVIRADALPTPVAIVVRLHADQRLSLRVDRTGGTTPFLAVDGSLSDEPVFSGTMRFDLDSMQRWLDAPAPWPTGVLDLQTALTFAPEPTLTVGPTSSGRIELAYEDTAVAVALAMTEALGLTLGDGGSISATGALPLQVEARRGPLALDGNFDIADFEFGTALDASARIEGTGRISWSEGDSTFSISLPLRAELAESALRLSEQAELTLEQLRYRETGLAELRVKNMAPVAVGAQGLLGTARLLVSVQDTARLELAARLKVDPAGTIIAEIDEASLPLAANDLIATLLPATVVPRSGRVDLAGRLQRSATGSLDGNLQTRWQRAGVDLPVARVRGASGAASLTYANDSLHVASATTNVDRLEWISDDGPQAMILFQELEGSASGSLDVASGKGFEPGDIAGEARLRAASITRGDYAAQEVEMDVEVSGDATGPAVAGRLRLASAAVGLPVSDVACGFDSADLERWRLSACSATALGGALRLPEGDFDLSTGSGYLPLAVDGLQLSAVLGLMQDPALDGTGTLDGSLPLRLRDMQPVVEQGWLAVRPPGGVLAYVTAADVLAGVEQPALRLTLRALRDLRYQRLESRVDYGEDGTLTLTVDLLGSNPDIEGGRPIQLNLNVTQNLLELLRSLRMSQHLERELQRRLQRVQP